MKKQVYLHSTHHPCTENAMNLNLLKRFYSANDWGVTTNPREADCLVVATCGFTQEEEDQEIKVIDDLSKIKKKDARIFITGCLPMIRQQRLNELFQAEYVEVTQINRFDEIMNFDVKTTQLDNNYVSEYEYDSDPEIHDFVKVRKGIEKYSFLPFIRVPKTLYPAPSNKWFVIRVAMGCTDNCSYCGIKHAHGFTKSTPMESIIEQAKKGIAQGFKEISLSGEAPGSYGVDINLNLAVLLEELLRLREDVKINLRYISPNWLIRLRKDLIPIFKTGRITNFCTPIQSGSNRILKLMNRRYTVEETKEIVNYIMRNTKVGMISTNVMVGFPGETEDDFNSSLRIFEEIDFGMYMVFKYSDRPGTKASKLPDKISVEEKERRFKIMNRAKYKEHLKITLFGANWLRRNQLEA